MDKRYINMGAVNNQLCKYNDALIHKYDNVRVTHMLGNKHIEHSQIWYRYYVHEILGHSSYIYKYLSAHIF